MRYSERLPIVIMLGLWLPVSVCLSFLTLLSLFAIDLGEILYFVVIIIII